MLGSVHFGPRLDCFADSSGPPFSIADGQEPSNDLNQKKLSKAIRGQLRMFDDEPVEISPTHPLAKQDAIELSEVWTRKDEDLDWDSLICSTDSKEKRQEPEPRSLEDLTSEIRELTAAVRKLEVLEVINRQGKISTVSYHSVPLVERSRKSEPTWESKSTSVTGLEDSRTSFGLHDLTGPVEDEFREKELKRYMGVNNLDFDIARLYAPTDNEQTYNGFLKEGVFESKSVDFNDIEERILPNARKVPREEDAKRLPSESEAKMLLTHQLENVQLLAEQLAISRAELGRSSVDGRETLNAADQMIQRASEWFEMMLDDLEKRIKDESVLEMRHNSAVDKKIGPILQKLYDLSILYETLNSLDKKTSLNDQTMRACKQNIQLARESIAKLLSNDAKIRASMEVKPSMIPLAANVSSAFIGFEHALLEMMTFTTSSPAATKLMESIISQMTGIHRAVMKAAPRAPISQYIRSLMSTAKITNFNTTPKPAYQAYHSKMGLDSVALQADTTKETTVFGGMPSLEENLFKPPKRRKTRSYIKLDKWPSAEIQISSSKELSPTLILSTHSATEPLSPYRQSDRTDSMTENCSSCRDAMKLKSNISSSTKKASNTTSDRLPSVVGSPGPSASDLDEPKITFDTAALIPNPRGKRNDSKSLTTTNSAPSTNGSVPQPTSRSFVPPKKTPDPIKISEAKKAAAAVNRKAENEKQKKRERKHSSTTKSRKNDPKHRLAKHSRSELMNRPRRKIIIDRKLLPESTEMSKKVVKQADENAACENREVNH